MKSNPYIAGNPVGGGEAFIGRADVLRDVLRVLNNPQESGVVLYGQRRIGKTSVLLELAANLPNKGNFLPVYFDLQDKAKLPLDEMLEELATRINYHLKEPTLQILQIEEGKTEDDAESHYWTNKGVLENFQHTFLPYVLSLLPEDTSLVLLFDEFDVMDTSGNQAGSAFFPYLRELMMLNPQRLKFLFVIGRRPEDLPNFTLPVFKGIKSLHVSLLSLEDTAELACLSSKNQTLNWPDEAVEHLHTITGGHPLLTQQLCQVVWENIYDSEPDDAPDDTPEATIEDIEQAIPEALKSATNALEWLWDGLKPAQRVVASALAEAGSGVITQDLLGECLQASGVRILIGELQNAAKTLEEWDLIRTQDSGYCFPSDMLRHWIVQRKPLARVQVGIDRILPVANNLFQAGYGLYQGGKLEAAIPLLKQAIDLNPNHLKANQLLAEVYLAEGDLDDAITLLENLYDYQPELARPRLIQAFLNKADMVSEYQKMYWYERLLNIEPHHPEVLPEYEHLQEKWKVSEIVTVSPEIASLSLPLTPFEFETVIVNTKGEIVANMPRKALQFIEELEEGVILEMIAISGGTFVMGSPENEKGRYDDEAPQHEVAVAPFLIGKHPITQAQWMTIMGGNPSYFKGDNRPVEQISWEDAMRFCQQISEKTSHEYDLPSEAEWKYACRSGTTTPFYCGETLTSELANYDGNYTYSLEPKGQYCEETTGVGIFPPNASGLYDMHGNVWEWCADDWHENYEGAPVNGSAWLNKDEAKTKSVRGGSWDDDPLSCRCASRSGLVLPSHDQGFRVVLRAGVVT